MLGAKTITAIGFAALTLVITGTQGILSVEQLSHLSAAACIVCGLFASIFGAMVARFWRIGSPSRGYLGLRRETLEELETRIVGPVIVGANPEARVRDLPPALLRACYIAVFLCVGLIAFSNRAVSMLTQIPERLSNVQIAKYCKERDPEAAKPKTKKVVARGCALILRAYRLGYTKKLGECAPKEVKGPAQKLEMCTDRQPNEPLLHYAWRQVSGKADKAAAVDPGGTLGKQIDEFQVKLGYLEALVGSQAHAVSASPRSSHHIWTNLPDPNPISLLSRWFVPQNCTSRYADLDLEVGWSPRQLSELVDHVLGHLLFSPRYGPPPGYCREYVVHWSAPIDACDRLRGSTTGFLDDSDALSPVRDVIDRYRKLAELRQLERDMGNKPRGNPLPDLQRVLSFNCLMVGKGGDGKVINSEVRVDGQPITVRQVQVAELSAAGAHQIEAYRVIASLLTGGAGYSGPVTDDPMARASEAPATPADLTGDDFALTKLEMLREADPFIGAGWPLERADMLEVYPFHVHVRTFTEVFRRRYGKQRGRL